jgi:glycine dehydrogenase subunit 1
MANPHHFIPNTDQDRQDLLRASGAKCFEDLLAGIPCELRYTKDLGVGKALSEFEITRHFKNIMKNSRESRAHTSFLGAGVYDHICPAAVNQLTLRGEFLTTYTPYQPEMAQGTLQALFEFQTLITEIFGMDVAMASHYDGSTATAEAPIMAMRVLGENRKRVLISQGVHPEYIETCKAFIANVGAEVCVVPLGEDGRTSTDALKSLLKDDVACVIAQSPNIMGVIEEQGTLSDLTHKVGALYVSTITEPLALGVIKSPGEYDADIVTGEGQSFGIPQSFGGPYLGLFACKQQFIRQMPGRLCGESVDAQGRKSYTLTLSTREQHIRREKATSNICSNQNLLALWATIWLSMIGKQGFVQLAENNLAKAEYAKEKLLATGKATLRYAKSPTFNEFVIDLKTNATDFVQKAVAEGIAPGLPLSRFFAQDQSGLLVCVTETKTREDIDALAALLKKLG